MQQPVAKRIDAHRSELAPFLLHETYSSYRQRSTDPEINDFTFGNPHEMQMPTYVEALQLAVIPQDPSWFAYKWSEPYAVDAVVTSLHARFGIMFEAEDIAMTTAGFGAIGTAIQAVVDPGDEVIYPRPPWFMYGACVVNAGGIPVPVPVDCESYDLDLGAIEAAITPRTRMVIVNTPCNPTGKIYPSETLERLAILLDEVSRRSGRMIYLLSDEAYNRIVFTDEEFHTPLEFYPAGLMAYSYGKTLLAPGERIGYLAMTPSMPERERLREAILVSQIVNGHLVPSGTLQRAVPELEKLCIDMFVYERKRDRMVSALRELGYHVTVPQGTFYVFPKTPWSDDWEFVHYLESLGTFVLPGTMFEFPGHFRICLTASEEMIERSLPHFASAMEQSPTHQAGRERRAPICERADSCTPEDV
jgi:aspartate aminotransferase